MALKIIPLRLKKWGLMVLFRGWEVKYHTDRLGTCMARKDEFSREYHHKKLHDLVKDICESKRLSAENFLLIEDDLNDYINRRVRAAHDKEAKKLRLRELLDSRIKIKNAGDGLPESLEPRRHQQ